MNTALSGLKFYAPAPSSSGQSKRQVACARKELLGLVLATAADRKLHEQDISQSVTIRIDTPVLRSQMPRQIVSMTSRTQTMPCKFFPTLPSTGGKPPQGRTVSGEQRQIEGNLSGKLTRMSIAQKKMEHGLAKGSVAPADHAENFKVTQVARHTARRGVRPQGEDRELCRRLMKTALLFLKEYAMSVKALLRARLAGTAGTGKGAASPVVPLRARPPLPMQMSYRVAEKRPSSKASTMANSPEIEEKLRAGAKSGSEPKASLHARNPTYVEYHCKLEPATAQGQSQTHPGQGKPRREKKRRYTTPANYPESDFPKTTCEAIERLAFEPVIK